MKQWPYIKTIFFFIFFYKDNLILGSFYNHASKTSKLVVQSFVSIFQLLPVGILVFSYRICRLCHVFLMLLTWTVSQTFDEGIFLCKSSCLEINKWLVLNNNDFNFLTAALFIFLKHIRNATKPQPFLLTKKQNSRSIWHLRTVFKLNFK